MDELEDLARALAQACAPHAVEAPEEREVLLHGEVGVDGNVLRHVTDPGAEAPGLEGPAENGRGTGRGTREPEKDPD